MRLVQVLIPTGKREAVLDALDDEGIDYAIFDETGRGEFEAMASFPVPPNGVEPVMDHLTEAGVEEGAYTIVLPTETVVSSRIDTLKARFPGLRISREELFARAQDLAPETSTFFIFLVLSTLIAATGLLLDSAATVIGAMVVAPLMGPAVSASVGAVLADREMARRGVRLQVTGLLAAIATAALLGLVIKESVLIPPGTDIREISQIAERLSPNFLSLFLAFGSGVAGAVSIIRSAGSTLVGVAIAVALVPPAATSGLGIAWGFPGVAIAAAVLVLVNLLAINLSALVLLWIAGFRPPESRIAEQARSTVVSRGAAIFLSLVVLSLVLGLVTFASFQSANFSQQVTAESQQFFDDPSLSQFRFEQATTDYTPADILLGETPEVRVIVSHPEDAAVPPDLAQRLDDRLTEATGREVVVRIGFVEAQETGDVPVGGPETPYDTDSRFWGLPSSLDAPVPVAVGGHGASPPTDTGVWSGHRETETGVDAVSLRHTTTGRVGQFGRAR